MGLHLHVNISDAANKLGQAEELISGVIRQGMETVATQARADLSAIAKSELSGYKLQSYLGTEKGQSAEEEKNISLTKVGEGMWVLELNEKARWVEEGRPEVFMSWLLKNAKTAKDGSKFKVIPMPQDKGKGTTNFTANSVPLQTMTQQILKQANVSLKKMVNDENGRPRIGYVAVNPGVVGRFEDKAEISPNRGDYFSKPRSWEDSKNTGLPQHNGIFNLQGLVVSQWPGIGSHSKISVQDGKVVGGKTVGVQRNAMTFRVISSKHEQEGRWFYPEVKALDAMPRVFERAQKMFEQFMKGVEDSFLEITR